MHLQLKIWDEMFDTHQIVPISGPFQLDH
jgi:hypothetical protein